jgi:hypothetical protein
LWTTPSGLFARINGTTVGPLGAGGGASYTDAQARAAISVSGSLAYNASTGVISYTAPVLATVATTGAYNDLSGKPTLGTAASRNITVSTAQPSGGADGDIWFVVPA